MDPEALAKSVGQLNIAHPFVTTPPPVTSSIPPSPPTTGEEKQAHSANASVIVSSPNPISDSNPTTLTPRAINIDDPTSITLSNLQNLPSPPDADGADEVGGRKNNTTAMNIQNVNQGNEQDMEASNSDEQSGSASQSSSSSMTPSGSDDASWITWFCALRGNEFFVEVDEDYIQDDFNLTGLNSLVPYYDYALDMILDVEMVEDQLTEEQQEVVESAAEMLYGLIHARYIVTNRGMHAMYEKYKMAAFGRCPRVFCQGQPVLPCGLSDLPRNYTVNVFCPKCHDLFYPKSTRQSNIDGAYFGTTFPHLYLMAHPETIPTSSANSVKYVPKVYGFKISKKSVYYRNREPDQVKKSSSRKKSSSSSVSYAQQQQQYEREASLREAAGVNNQRK
ncbi:hypothetical protein TrLO_g1817 [Triparma laevis f. longispina]|uniref:Casein kinase II subunit beta n=1 Tax=Triparma laevis f. longispina TaxID=1714387 RepID=A0A9W7AE02_9STRA|nr:hypothetical protein TrLO_g1817 [Triparma laevis f. longispina]